MSFGFGGGGNNNTSAFGGFGSSNTGGFGANNNASTGGTLFGGNTATAGGGFGGFGSNNQNNSPFGQNKSTFGATNTTSTAGGLFGGNTATAGGFGGGGGFGNAANTGSGFGGNTGGGLFGQKTATPGFGASNSGTTLFGNQSNTGGGFGSTNNNTSNPFSTNTNQNTGGFGSTNTGSNFTFGGASTGAANNSNSGTGSTPFQEFSEKDGGVNNAVSKYQSITFQQPYQAKSFEELRLEDYAQGRKTGNTNGQAGGFGQSTGFGNFGGSNTTSTGGGMFGGNTATAGNTGFGGGNTGGFGSSNTNTGGMFGSNTNTGGGLFGAQQNKPASGGLFGSTNTNTNSGFGSNTNTNTGGGLFGASNSGFGGSNTNSNTGGGLFGNNNQQQQQQQQQQNKPAFGGFGSTTNNNTTGGFGQSTNTGGGPFGSSANTNTGGLFGNQNNQQPQQQQQSNPFGASTNTGGGLFGNQNKPATGGLFGNTNTTNTGGGLFGGAQNTQQQSNPFGGSTNTGGGLFGNQAQNKPASTGLFGSSTNQSTSGGGLFGGQNNQQGGSSLFGNNTNTGGGGLFGNQNKPASGGLFGNTTNTNTNAGGLSLFGNNQAQQNNTGGGLFGGSLGQNNQNQQNANQSSLFGGSFGGNNQQGTPQQQNQLHATLTGAPYGNEQLFSSLGAPSPPVGPLATPLAGGRAAPRKTPSLLASARLNTPVYSPRAGSIGRNGGYGFSYSTYGTPGSAFTSGSLTPGASSLLRPTGSLGSALTSRLNKSLSTSNLRGDGTPSDGRSLLRPSAFSSDGTPGFQNGSVRRLKIDRSLRTDIFGANRTIEAAKESDAPSLKKRVSFENAAAESNAEPTAANALVRTEEPEEEEPSPAGLLRAGPERPRAPEMEQVSNGALSTVPEDTEIARPSSAPGIKASMSSKKSEVGDYWTKPAMKDLKHMSRQQLKNIGNFIVGRENVGRIEFGAVDLTNTPLEDICGSIVKLTPRSATVYENDTDKPAVGKALNVPSTIYLENSWPRSHGGKMPVHAKSGKAYDKHIARLKRVAGTKFLNYNADTGVWSFTVEHFTTYALDDDDDDESEFLDQSVMQEESSGLSDPPHTPTGQHDETVQSLDAGTGEVEDTFQFKLDQRSRLSSIPGGFDEEGVSYDYDDPSADEGMDEDEHMMSSGLGHHEIDEDDPFMDNDVFPHPPGHAVRQQEEADAAARRNYDEEHEHEHEQEMPGSFAEPKIPKSILKPTTALSAFASPEKIANESWEERLQATRSPKKRDRQVLKEMQKDLLRARGEEAIESPFKKSMMGLSVGGGLDESYLARRSAKKAKLDAGTKPLGESQNFRTAMDIMDNIFTDSTKGRKIAAGGKGFEYPYPKRARLSSTEMPSQDAQWHDNLKPSFSNTGILAYSAPGSAPQPSGELVPAIKGFVGEHYDVRFSKLAPTVDIHSHSLTSQKAETTYETSGSFPHARAPDALSFAYFNQSRQPTEDLIWHLCSILFDPLEHAVRGEYLTGMGSDQMDSFEDLLRLDTLREFWQRLVAPHVQEGLKRARSPEEKAVYYLTQNDIASACETLVAAKDFKLATMIAQLPSSKQNRRLMKEQISAWKQRNDWAEMSEPIRALYSIIAGEVCSVQGKVDTTENRVVEFTFSKRFELSWQQGFALRLFFGGHQSIRSVVHDYKLDLDHWGRETQKPMSIWANGKKTSDALFEILSLVQQPRSDAVLDASTVSGSMLNSRLAWQITMLLNATDVCRSDQARLDQLTYDFAMELEQVGDFVTSVWALLHIGNAEARQKVVAAILNRNGGRISTPGADDGASFRDLAQTLHIPTSLIWTAKALYAKAGLHNPALETEWLIIAGDVEAAHEILCSTLGPQAVIEQDYDILQRSLELFPRRLPEGWQRGGQVYLDFVRLNKGRSRQRLSADDEAAMKRLRRGLAEMEEESEKLTQVERVAIFEMGRVLDEVVREHHGNAKDGSMDGIEDVAGVSVGAEMLAMYQQAMGIGA